MLKGQAPSKQFPIRVTSLGTTFKLGKQQEKEREISSGVLAASLKNKHQVAEIDFSVGPTSRTLMRMQRKREGYCGPSRCSLPDYPAWRNWYANTAKYKLVDLCSSPRTGPLIHWAHGTTLTTHPQSASPEKLSQLPCFCATIWLEAGSEFGIHSRHEKELAYFVVIVV